jgi:hypothetical protein
MIVIAGHVGIDPAKREQAIVAAREMQVQRYEVSKVGPVRP